jgi:Cu+-exporting ATPase
MVTARVALSERLPIAHRDCDRCLDRLIATVRDVRGVIDIQPESNRAGATVIYDPQETDLTEIEVACTEEGQRACDLYTYRTLAIEGMTCTDCAARLEAGLARLDGVHAVSVNFIGARMDIEYRDERIDPQTIARRVSELGYSVAEAARSDGNAGTAWSFLRAPSLRPTLAAAILTLLGLGMWLANAPGLLPTALFGGAALVGGLPIAR